MRTGACGGERGFTLIELTVTIAIIIMVVTLISISITNIRRADLNAATGMLGAAMRYTYNLAIINNTPYRLVIDLDEGKYWGEELETDDPCARYLPEKGEEPGERLDPRVQARAERDAADALPEGLDVEGLEAAEGGTDAAGERIALEGPSGGGYRRKKDNLLSERTLPKGIVVTGVITEHHEMTQEEGRVAIHFFPTGRAEDAWLWLGEGSDDENELVDPSLTLALDGLMGNVKQHRTALDPQKFLQLREEREEAE